MPSDQPIHRDHIDNCKNRPTLLVRRIRASLDAQQNERGVFEFSLGLIEGSFFESLNLTRADLEFIYGGRLRKSGQNVVVVGFRGMFSRNPAITEMVEDISKFSIAEKNWELRFTLDAHDKISATAVVSAPRNELREDSGQENRRSGGGGVRQN